MTVHHLKTEPGIFETMESGKKLFDYRKNDRDFKIGDCINIVAYYPETDSCGSSIDFEVTYILYGGKIWVAKGILYTST
ncbi:hypothetical protein LCGC14_1178360 [marine sediment metagenome]|uniref:DUF3850 domain-containing protein n=1 Tax=marine sediment metagenome TaxID=412755 RepID=A0A0F9LMY5_9ZZZZ